MSTTRRNGFTVVEMLVVIAIIGIITSMVLPAVMGARERARQAQCTNNLRNLALAVATFETSKNRFPGSQELLLPHDPASMPTACPGYNKPARFRRVENSSGPRWLGPLARSAVGSIGSDIGLDYTSATDGCVAPPQRTGWLRIPQKCENVAV